jgi:hypothetical protein
MDLHSIYGNMRICNNAGTELIRRWLERWHAHPLAREQRFAGETVMWPAETLVLRKCNLTF